MEIGTRKLPNSVSGIFLFISTKVKRPGNVEVEVTIRTDILGLVR